MFESNVYTTTHSVPGHLTVSAPGSSLFGLWWVIFCLVLTPLLYLAVARSVRRTDAENRIKYPQLDLASSTASLAKLRNISAVLTLCVPVFFYCIGYTSGSIDLDRSTNQATMTGRMTAFLPAQKHSVDLSSINNAVLDEKPNSRRIRLVVSRGRDLAFPIWSSRAGQDEAVEAINEFLRTDTGK